MAVGYDSALVRYGELSLKGPLVRTEFEVRLAANIADCLKRAGVDHVISRTRGRIAVGTSQPARASELVSKVFGVVSVSPAITVPANIEAIKEAALRVAGQRIVQHTPFRVDTNRGDKSFPMTSQQVNVEVGEEIRRNTGGKVNLGSPSVTIGIDIRQRAFIFDQVFKGPGGLPLGTAGKAVSLFSGGIDSPVATYLIMKRGCEVVLLHFDNAPFCPAKSRDRTVKVARVLAGFASGSRMKLLIAPLGHCLSSFIEDCPRGLTCTLCKRMMTRIAERVANLHGCTAIVSGSSLAQVCSQTMQNLALTVSASSIPVLMPLVGLDKEEIVEVAKRIGTYGESTSISVTCTATPRHPRTAPTKKEVEEAEAGLDIEVMVKRSIDGIEEVELA